MYSHTLQRMLSRESCIGYVKSCVFNTYLNYPQLMEVCSFVENAFQTTAQRHRSSAGRMESGELIPTMY